MNSVTSDRSAAAQRAASHASRVDWGPIVSAFCASLIGIGLARFAYTPLLPALVDAHWFDASQGAYLGAANLAGYLAGALLGRSMAARSSVVRVLRVMMLAATAAFVACAFPLGFLWYFVWRFLAGLAGGALMVLAAPAVLPHVAPSRRGLAAGVIFMGVGVGVAISGTLVPLLLQLGLKAAWLGLGGLALLLSLIGWGRWPAEAAAAAAPAGETHRRVPGLDRRRLGALYAGYALNAAGWVPHMIFLVDFVARGLGRGVQAGAGYWVMFGAGATLGPVLAGLLADRVGFGSALRLAFVLEAAAVAVPVITPGPVWLAISSLVVGAFVTGTVPLVLGRLHEMMPHHPALQRIAWSRATVGFALCQAAAAYGLSYVFAHSGGNYRLLFTIATAAMVAALLIDLVAARVGTPRRADRRAWGE